MNIFVKFPLKTQKLFIASLITLLFAVLFFWMYFVVLADHEECEFDSDCKMGFRCDLHGEYGADHGPFLMAHGGLCVRGRQCASGEILVQRACKNIWGVCEECVPVVNQAICKTDRDCHSEKEFCLLSGNQCGGVCRDYLFSNQSSAFCNVKSGQVKLTSNPNSRIVLLARVSGGNGLWTKVGNAGDATLELNRRCHLATSQHQQSCQPTCQPICLAGTVLINGLCQAGFAPNPTAPSYQNQLLPIFPSARGGQPAITVPSVNVDNTTGFYSGLLFRLLRKEN